MANNRQPHDTSPLGVKHLDITADPTVLFPVIPEQSARGGDSSPNKELVTLSNTPKLGENLQEGAESRRGISAHSNTTEQSTENESEPTPSGPIKPHDYWLEYQIEEDIGMLHGKFLKKFSDAKVSHSFEAVTRFITTHKYLQNCLGEPDKDDTTLLHAIARTLPHDFDEWRELFKWLMTNYPVLYQVEDGDGGTVLSNAIRSSKCSHFVKFFTTEFPKQTSVVLQKDRELFSRLLPMVQEATLGLLDELDHDILMYKYSEGNTLLHLVSQYNYIFQEPSCGLDTHGIQLELAKDLVRRCPKLLKVTNNVGHSAYLHRIHTFSTNHLNEKYQESGIGWAVHDNIAQYLMNEYMHLDDRDEIIRFLQGSIQVCEIHLDLLELAYTDVVSEQQLVALIRSLRFETVLQYVRIPGFRDTPNRVVSVSKYPKRSWRLGTEGGGFWFVFQLLREKGVRKIIKVIVDDEEDFHRDEIIEQLVLFDIEEWDWIKLDLCSEIIRRAAPNVRKVSLYSSGQNAVLRGWSGNDGLNSLTQLSDVCVVIHQGLESVARTRMYLDEFTRRLRKSCPTVSFDCRVQRAAGGMVTPREWLTGDIEEDERNAWFEDIDKFLEFVRDIPPETNPPMRLVKVAIIDDGIDMFHGKFQGSIANGVSFHSSGGLDTIMPYFFSSSGHGTMIAKVIYRVCPTAEFYITRVEEASFSGRISQPTAKSAAKAIDWAINVGVDVICCAWTIPVSDNNKDDLDRLESAILRAHSDKILIFGAASDQGYKSNVQCYPGSMAQVFCIGAARLSGHVEDTTARESQFVFPADVRMGTAGQGLALNDHNLATALAAGLAALILYCVGVVGLENCDGLREYNAMDTIFQGMVSSYQPKYVKAESFRGFSETVWDKRGREKFRTTMEKITRYVDDAVSDIGAPLPSVINVLTQHLHSGLSIMHGNRIKDE